MKVLWLCNILPPICSKAFGEKYSISGGWLDLISRDMAKEKDIKFIICCPGSKKKIEKLYVDNVTYFRFYNKMHISRLYSTFLDILNTYKPDIIHIFGTEYCHTYEMVNAAESLLMIDKVIISIQGLVSVIEKYYLEGIPNCIRYRYTIRDLLKANSLENLRNSYRRRGVLEKIALKKVKHVIGRTDWDKACVQNINSNANYYLCNETMRSSFYEYTWDYQNCEKYSIFVSQANYPVKGFHRVIEALEILIKKFPNTRIYVAGKDPFSLKWYRITSYQKYLVSLINKARCKHNIIFLGNLDEKMICNQFLKANVFVLASSIENSSNSLAEAMLLGVPCVVSDVGGVMSMIVHKKEGFVFQNNAPYMMSFYIEEIFKSSTLAQYFSVNAKAHARIVHNRVNNYLSLLNIYKQVCK
jgi:glycosyltransferase involved in cell wall biosynthesis